MRANTTIHIGVVSNILELVQVYSFFLSILDFFSIPRHAFVTILTITTFDRVVISDEQCNVVFSSSGRSF